MVLPSSERSRVDDHQRQRRADRQLGQDADHRVLEECCLASEELPALPQLYGEGRHGADHSWSDLPRDRRHDQASQQHGADEVGHRVDPEGQCQVGAQEGHEDARQRVAGDVSHGLAGPDGAKSGREVLATDDARQDGRLGWSEEQTDGGDREDEWVDEQDVRLHHERDDEDETGSQQVAHDHHELLVPAIHEGPRQRAEQEIGQGGGQEDHAGLQRRAGDGEDHHAHGDLVESVAEQTDGACQPEGAEACVSGEADVGVPADPLAQAGRGGGDGGSRCRQGVPRPCRWPPTCLVRGPSRCRGRPGDPWPSSLWPGPRPGQSAADLATAIRPRCPGLRNPCATAENRNQATAGRQQDVAQADDVGQR